MTPAELRSQIARGEWTTATAGVLMDYQQTNLVIKVDQDLHLRQVPRSSTADLAPPCDQASRAIAREKSLSEYLFAIKNVKMQSICPIRSALIRDFAISRY